MHGAVRNTDHCKAIVSLLLKEGGRVDIRDKVSVSNNVQCNYKDITQIM